MHFMYYNFVRLHKTLRMTPAMALGVTDHIWDIGELVEVASNPEPAMLEGKRVGVFRVINGGKG